MTRKREHEATRGPTARPGWIFDVRDRHPGAPTCAEILEVLDVPGYRVYRVRWEDGSESSFIPSIELAPRPPAAVGA